MIPAAWFRRHPKTRDALISGAITLGFLILVAALPRPAASAPDACMDRAQMVAEMARQYGEARQFVGLAGPSQVVEVFANLATGTWTIIATKPDGQSCMVAAGEMFQHLAEPPGDPA